MVHGVKDLVLSLRQLGALLKHGLGPWPDNFHMPQMWPKKKKKKKKNPQTECFTVERLLKQEI